MGSQLEKIYSELLYKVGCYCEIGTIWCKRNKAIMYRSILDHFSKEHSKDNLLDPIGPLSNKILQSTISAAKTEVMCVMNGSS